MAKLAFLTRILAGASVGMCSLAFAWTASAQVPAGTPDFSSANRAWLRVGIPFLDPVSGKILGEDPEHPFSTRGVDAQGRDVSGTPSSPDWKNKNLKPWAAQKLKEYADEAQKGKIRITASASCWPGGTPGQMIFNEPLFLLQSPDKITLLYQRDHFVRHIYMNVPHTKNPKPSWFGESVGHYEGDELVVDTTGFNDKGELDNWGTPHTGALQNVGRRQDAARQFHGRGSQDVQSTLDGRCGLSADDGADDRSGLLGEQFRFLHRRILSRSRSKDGGLLEPAL